MVRRSPVSDAAPARRRIFELDLLRGFFIFVVIVDHLQRWPNPLTYVTGEGRLWVSAAEGFFIISGLLIGYIRGHKQRDVPIKTVTTTLLKRAGLLYVWSVIISALGVALCLAFNGDPRLVPFIPALTPPEFAVQILTQAYVFDWIYFLRLYWIMLLAAPLAVLLFRTRYWWSVPIISLAVYAATLFIEQPEAALQWQALFFIAATIGLKLDVIIIALQKRPALKRTVVLAFIIATLSTMVISYFYVFGWQQIETGRSFVSRENYDATRTILDPIFSKAPLAPARVALALLWTGGLLCLFHVGRRFIKRYLGWLLMSFGTYSLTAYCLQAITLIPIQIIFPIYQNWLTNLLLSALSVMIVWGLLRVPIVRRILPQ